MGKKEFIKPGENIEKYSTDIKTWIWFMEWLSMFNGNLNALSFGRTSLLFLYESEKW